MSNIMVPSELGSGFKETCSTDEAAVLRSMGCDPIEGAPCRVEHDKFNPYDSGRGRVFFTLSGASSTWRKWQTAKSSKPMSTAALSIAYNEQDGGSSVALDELIEQISDEELRVKIKNALPLAVANYGRAFGIHRAECMSIVKKSAHIAIGTNRGGRRFAIDVRNKEFARRFNCE